MKASRILGTLASALLITLGGCGGGSGGGADASGIEPRAAGAESPATLASGNQNQSAPALSAASQAGAASSEPTVIESKVSQGSNQNVDPFKTRATNEVLTPGQVALPSLSADSKGRTIQKAKAATPGVPAQTGVAREIPDTATFQKTAGVLGWSTSSTGAKVAALRFRSPEAQGVRVGLLVKGLPFGSVVRFYADGTDKIFEIPGQEIMASIQRNLDAGDTGDAARTYWSPNLGGEAITVELEVPADTDVTTVQVAVPSLSHAFVNVSKFDSVDAIAKIGESGSCNLDVSCNASYSETSKSVAAAEFVKDGNTYVCTGTLLNDRMSSGTPYFLTANHCISSQSVASTLYTYWFFRSVSCNNPTLNAGVRVLTTGATLLYFTSATDTSFMRLNSAAPAGAVFAGSSPYPTDLGTRIAGIHHPQGDLQKYSEGLVTGSCYQASGLCSSAMSPDAGFLRVNWTAGVTEGGSSGSGLFTKMNGKDYLTGQLYGGYSSCAAPTSADFYGRFDVAYIAALYKWLNNSSTTSKSIIYRFYNTRSRAHFYTSDVTERDHVIAKFDEYKYDGAAFYAYSGPAPGTSPVHRFFNTENGSHFYTINEAERQYVASHFSSFKYDGVAWYANTVQGGPSSPMYRFYNDRTRTHFYTINAAERDYVAQTFSSEFHLEGIGYFAWTAP